MSAISSLRPPTPTQVIGVSAMHVSRDPSDVLITYSLGSCIGVTVYDPKTKIGGMIHCLLPCSKAAKAKAAANPAMFVDSGIVTMLQALCDLGAVKRRLVVKVAGGANSMDPHGRFRVGERNYTVLRKALWKNELLIASERIGGTVPRTVILQMDSGITMVKEGGEVFEL